MYFIQANYKEFFFKQKAEIATQDATFVLAYSVILLNTDLHNPQVRVCYVCFFLNFFKFKLTSKIYSIHLIDILLATYGD